MDYQNQALILIRNLNQRMSSSIYDTAWLLRLKELGGKDLIEPSLPWLLERQYEDGSWGADIRYYHHDRIICTLIVAIALAEQEPTPEIKQAIIRAENYLWQNAHLLYRDPAFTELVGFELLFPTLMDNARMQGLAVPLHNYGMGEIQNEKLRLIPPEMLYSKNLTTVHSIEFLGSNVKAVDLHKAVFENGSLGNSPSATAYYLMICQAQNEIPNAASIEYLNRVTSKYQPTNYLYPFRNFEHLWVLNNFSLIEGFKGINDFAPEGYLENLQVAVEQDGISLDDEFGIADADCTSVAYYLLGLAGREPDPSTLAKFEVPGEKFFRTYYFERNPSISTNIHALEALRLMPRYPHREDIILGIKKMLYASRRFKLFWTDKWHASPYYATAYALIALLDGEDNSTNYCRNTLDWVAHAQRKDGSWGFFNKGTMEETAYALLALQKAYRFGIIDADVLKRGINYLTTKLDKINPQKDYEELWLGKCLYAPYDIIHSAVLSALIQHENIFGKLP